MNADLRHRYAEALAAKFTSSIPRCDKWGENEWTENPEPADRVEQSPRIVFIAGDGDPAFRMPTCMELGEVVAAVRDEDLERLRLIASVNHGLHRSAHEEADGWRERAETAETDLADAIRHAERLTRINRRMDARIARIRLLADRLVVEPHPTHDHLCPDDVRKRLLAALDDSQETGHAASLPPETLKEDTDRG